MWKSSDKYVFPRNRTDSPAKSVDVVSGALPEVKRPDAVRFPGRPSKRVICDLISVVDMLLILGAALTAHWTYLNLYLENTIKLDSFFIMGLLGAMVAVLVLRNQGLYTFERLSSFRGQSRRIAVGLAVSALALLTVSYLLKISATFSRGWMLTWFVYTWAALFVGHYFIARKLRRWIEAGVFTHNVVIYGSGNVAKALVEHLSLGPDPVHIRGVYDDLPRNETPRVVVAGGLSDLIRAGQDGHIDEVLVALPMSDGSRLVGLMNELSILPVNIRLCPDMAAFRLRPVGVVNYHGISILELARRPLDDWAPIMKALEDRILAAVMLVLLAPLGLFIAAAIRLNSQGPVFFRQRRHGFNHGIINVWKFRTMYVTEDGGVIPQAKRHDSRVTAVGRFLRRTSLDELPQLINVLKGEMSLVGPRPHALAHNEYYGALVERYANRHRMKPGITGWAQVNGYRGETDTPDKMRKRIELDLYYIENWSLWFDIKIIILTPFLGLWGRNAF